MLKWQLLDYLAKLCALEITDTLAKIVSTDKLLDGFGKDCVDRRATQEFRLNLIENLVILECFAVIDT